MYYLIGVVAGGGRAGPSLMVGATAGGVVKPSGRGVLRLSRSRGIAKYKTMKDVSNMSRMAMHCSVTVASNVNMSVQSVTVEQKFMSRLRCGRDWSSDNPEIVDLSGDKEVPKSRRGYVYLKFFFSDLILFLM